MLHWEVGIPQRLKNSVVTLSKFSGLLPKFSGHALCKLPTVDHFPVTVGLEASIMAGAGAGAGVGACKTHPGLARTLFLRLSRHLFLLQPHSLSASPP